MKNLHLVNKMDALIFLGILGLCLANSPTDRNQQQSIGDMIGNDLRLRELSDDMNTFKAAITKQIEDFKNEFLIRVVTLETKLEMLTQENNRINPMEIMKLFVESQKQICKLETAVDGLKTGMGLVSEKQQLFEHVSRDFNNLSEVVRQHDVKLQGMDSQLQQVEDVKQNVSIISTVAFQNEKNLRNISSVSIQQKQNIDMMMEQLNQNHLSDNSTLWNKLLNMSLKYDRELTNLHSFAENVSEEIQQHNVKLQKMDSDLQQLEDVKQNVSIIYTVAFQNEKNLRSISNVSIQQKQNIYMMMEQLKQIHLSDNFTLWNKLQKMSLKYDRELTDLQSFAEKSKKEIAFTAGIPHYAVYESGQTINFTRVITNIGGGLNVSDGVFYCKEPGLYYFYVNISLHSSTYAYANIRKNGNHLMYVKTDSSDGWKSGSNAVFLQLDRGDTVYVTSHSTYNFDNAATLFSGYKI